MKESYITKSLFLLAFTFSSLFYISSTAHAATLENGFLAWARWTTSVSGVIETANLDGSGTQIIAPNATTPISVTSDRLGDIYYTELSGGSSGTPGKVIKTNLSGSVSSTIYTAPDSNRLGAIDMDHSKLYWSSLGVLASPNELHSSDLDGMNESVIPVENPQPGNKQFRNISIDNDYGKIFWSFSGTNSNIVSSNLDGSNSEVILPGLYDKGAFSLDRGNQFVYYAGDSTSSDSSIYRSNYDGSDAQLFLELGVIISGIEVDEAAEWIYWSEGNSFIRRANINDLSTIETVFSGSGLRGFTVVSAVPVPPAIWLFGSGLLGLIGAARRKKA